MLLSPSSPGSMKDPNTNTKSEIDRRYQVVIPVELARHIPDDEELVVTMESDMTRSGQFSPSYLIITRQRVLGLEEGEPPVVLPLSEIEECETDELFGGGRIVSKTKDGTIAIISFSRSFVPEFAAATRIIDDLAHDRDLIYPELEGSAFSEGSGVPLPERGGRSPLDMPRRKILKQLGEFVRPYRARIWIMMLLFGLSVLAQMTPPLLSKFVVDNILGQGDFQASTPGAAKLKLNLFVLLIALSILVVFVTRIVANILKVWISGRLTADLRNHLHRQMQRLTMRYHNRKESGELVGRVMNDTSELQHFLVEGVPFLYINSLSFIGIGAILIWIHPLLALCVFLPVPLLLFGGTWFWRRLVPLFHKRGNRNSVLHSVLGESISAVKATKALGQEDRRHRIFNKGNESFFNVSFHVERTFLGFFEMMALMMGVGTVAVWFFGGHSILDPDSDFTIGDLVAFMFFMAMFYGPLQWFTAVINWMTHAFASSERILQILDQKPETYDAPNAVALPEVEGKISFKDVRFSYNRGNEVIKGLSFEIAPGEMIGLVGKSGAGKSTIVNLVCRFYDPDSGQLTIDSHDLRSVKLTDWRRHIGIVMQDPFLFGCSIADNISYGNHEATFEDIMRAARAAEAHEFILSKEEGYDTVVGEGGVDLSGGERQRIAIARAILSDPPILILDEATSSVDSETEKAIQQAITTLVKGRTVIAIAHRLATLRNADRLIVIEDGKIIEEGTHEKLLGLKDGHFANLVKLQTENNKLLSEQSAYSME